MARVVYYLLLDISTDLERFVVTTSTRLLPVIICAIILNCAQAGTAFAGFFGSDEQKSGLDFNRGYDVNTVSTISGRVSSLPHPGEKDNVLIEIKSGGETLNISVGPGSYWEKNGLAVKLNDELSVKGSKAQGKDGKSYLLAQKLVNRSTGAQLDLRNDKGEGVWSGKNQSSMKSEGTAGSMRNQGGSMMRSGDGGMMRSGGGGMMRSGGGGMMRR